MGGHRSTGVGLLRWTVGLPDVQVVVLAGCDLRTGGGSRAAVLTGQDQLEVRRSLPSVTVQPLDRGR